MLLSFYFWINLLKGLVVYSFIPASCALIITISDMGSLHESDIKMIYKRNYQKYNKYKLQSFLFIFIIILCYVTLFYLNDFNNNISTIFTIFIIYIGLMTIILFTYCIHFLAFKNLDFKQSILLSFVTAIKKIIISGSILGFYLLLYTIAKMNLFLFIVFVPIGYGLFSFYVIKGVVKESEVT